MFRKITIVLSLLFFIPWNVSTQVPTPPAKPDYTYKPLTLKLNEESSKFVRFLMWHQFWTTATQNNPGTVDVEGKNIGDHTSFDISLRRSRFLAYAQMSPRFLILTHWGINNQSFINGGVGSTAPTTSGAAIGSGSSSSGGKKPQLFLHDAWTEFAAIHKKLHIGVGLHYWNGISRLTSHSTLNFMTMDAPIFNWPTIETSDQFARQFGIYAKGQLGRFDYRLSLNKPFVAGVIDTSVTSLPSATGRRLSSIAYTEKIGLAGYFNYMFWDKEDNTLPFFVGSYLGAKKVLNLGLGFYHQADAMASTFSDAGQRTANVKRHPFNCIGADLFLDMPIFNKKQALSILATFFNYDMGPNYVRNIGILNEHATVTAPTAGQTAASWAGGGNAQPAIGTGQIFYTQVGWVAKQFANGHKIMPYATVTYKNFERLADPSTQFGLGLNWFILNHNAKITAEYATRPIYKLSTTGTDVIENVGSRGQFTIQTHIFL